MGARATFRPEPRIRALRALRAGHWWYFALLPLAAVVDEAQPLARASQRSLASVVVAGACLSFSYGINGVMDRGMDTTAEKNALAGEAGVPREATALLALSVVVALAVSFALGRSSLGLAASSLVAGWVYSAPPRLKRLPFVGTLANVAIFAPLPLLATGFAPAPHVVALEFFFCVLLTQNQLLHELSDAEEDARGGVRTTGVRLGTTGFRISALVLGPLAAWPACLLSIPPFARAVGVASLLAGSVFLAAAREDRAARQRVGHRLCSLAFGVALFSLLASARFR